MDYGTRRIGIAISDPLGMIAQGLETIPNSLKEREAALTRVKTLLETYEIEDFVVGLPLRTDGKESESERKVREFISELNLADKIRVHFVDERYSTTLGHRLLNESGQRKGQKAKRQVIDQVAACVFLQDYLDHH